MWRLIRRLTKPQFKECTHHDQTKFPHLIANEMCSSCEDHVCYMCANQHIENGHYVRISSHATQVSDFLMQEKNDRESINQHILHSMNGGSIVYLDIEQLKCICGKEVNEHTAICAACGTATCSPECHKELERQDLCKFHHNFTAEAKNVQLRSILVRNAFRMYDQGFAVGTIFSRTSTHFITGFLSEKRTGVYLQRGYRQYGNPQNETLNAMDLVRGGDMLDKEVHLMRVCTCTCGNCKMLGYHPVYMCQHFCRSKDMFKLRGYHQENINEAQELCECRCEFCTSGITQLTHKKGDCFLKCQFR